MTHEEKPIPENALDYWREPSRFQWMWQEKSIEARNALQCSGIIHPYTCGNNRHDAAHKAYQAEHGGDFGQLVATEAGWICPVPGCGYTQPYRGETA